MSVLVVVVFQAESVYARKGKGSSISVQLSRRPLKKKKKLGLFNKRRKGEVLKKCHTKERGDGVGVSRAKGEDEEEEKDDEDEEEKSWMNGEGVN